MKSVITYPEPAVQSTGEKLMAGPRPGVAMKNAKRIKSNGWQDKRLPSQKKTASPLLG